MRHNLFRFATSELSHSALWAWVLQSLDSLDADLSDVRQLAEDFLEVIGIRKGLTSPIDVKTEVGIGEGQRIDIQVRDASGLVIAIENKVKAIPTKEQLEKYEMSLGVSPFLVFLSVSFHPDVLISKSWRSVTLDDLVNLTHAKSVNHPLLKDYAEWLEDLQNQRVRCQRDALGHDDSKRKEALNTAEGQWSLMSYLTESMDGHQYRAVGRDGKPWTEFRFKRDLQDYKMFDALSYRLDSKREGHTLSIVQSQSKPYPSTEKKAERFRMLQRVWFNAWGQVEEKAISPAIRNPRKAKSTEMIRFPIDEIAASDLKQPLLRAHNSFVETITAEGWPVYQVTNQT